MDQKPATIHQNRNSSRYLFFSASTASLAVFVCGICLGWPSPTLPKLGDTDPDNNPLPAPTTPDQDSWIASLINLGALISPILTSRLLTKYGRKIPLLIMSIPVVVSFVIIIFARTVYLFYIARFVQGIGVGSIFTVLPIYVIEISQDHNRGFLGCLIGVFIASGVLYAYIIGSMLSVRNFAIACLLPLLLFMVVFGCLIPESPQFFANINDLKSLEDSLRMLRPSRYNIDEELMRFTKSDQPIQHKQRTLKELLKIKSNQKSIIISINIMILQQFSGINAVGSYMHSIFQSTSTGISPELCVTIVGVVQVIVTIITSLIVEKLGRKLLLLISTLFCCISLFALTCYFYFELKSLNWLPIVSLLVYIIAFNIGLGPIPWTIVNELLSHEIKAFATSLIGFIIFAVAFLVTLAFPIVSLLLGIGLSFLIFAICCLFGCVFLYYFVPETKGRTLDEIQQILAK